LTGKESPKFAVEPLDTSRHDRAAFYCEEEPLTKYIRERASQEIAKRVTAVYVITSDGKTIAGYYTLSQYTIDAGDIPEEVFKKLRLPKYKTLPATLLGRFARDGRFKGTGLGELLLMSALEQALHHSQRIASCAVVVEAKNERAARFYQSFGFLILPGHTDRLFLPMQTIEGMFAQTADYA
jgi:predicted GNAT family N-acyltransferase